MSSSGSRDSRLELRISLERTVVYKILYYYFILDRCYCGLERRLELLEPGGRPNVDGSSVAEQVTIIVIHSIYGHEVPAGSFDIVWDIVQCICGTLH